MTDEFTRPYVDGQGNLVYLTDAQFIERRKHTDVRRLRPGEVITPHVEGETQISPSPLTSDRQAADVGPIDPVRHGVPEVREREVP
jgi:hypothetical protein